MKHGYKAKCLTISILPEWKEKDDWLIKRGVSRHSLRYGPCWKDALNDVLIPLFIYGFIEHE